MPWVCSSSYNNYTPFTTFLINGKASTIIDYPIDDYENACTHIRVKSVNGCKIVPTYEVSYIEPNGSQDTRNYRLTEFGSDGYREYISTKPSYMPSYKYRELYFGWTDPSVEPINRYGRYGYWFGVRLSNDLADTPVDVVAFDILFRELVRNSVINTQHYPSDLSLRSMFSTLFGLDYNDRTNFSTAGGSTPYTLNEIKVKDMENAAVFAGSQLGSSEIQRVLNDLFIEAISDTKLAANNIANALEIVNLVKGLQHPSRLLDDLVKQIKSIPSKKGLGSLWLKYRYQYTTTKSDIEDAIAKIGTTLTGRDIIIIRKSATEPADIHLKVVLKEDLQKLADLADVLKVSLKSLGLWPDAYTVWDMVPFSFVADWFLPIGDALEKVQLDDWYRSMPYTASFIASVKGEFEFNGMVCEYYTRQAISFDDGIYLAETSSKKPTVNTWIKRGLDIVSLKQ